MNIDDFLDKVDGDKYTAESASDTKNSLKLHNGVNNVPTEVAVKQKAKVQSNHEDEIDFLNESLSQSWDEQVTNLVSQINQSIAENDYEFAIQKYLELKELPPKIIEQDLRTQARLKNELQLAHQKLTVHMQEIEQKHSEQTSQLKKLIQLAHTELQANKEEVASGLYLKACQIYNTLPSEFQTRNVKLHYDLLKLYFAIKESHDLHEDAKQSEFVQTFTDKYNQALAMVQSNVDMAKEIHDHLHDNVLTLPNEEIKLKSELLEQLVFLKNQISVVLSKQKSSQQRVQMLQQVAHTHSDNLQSQNQQQQSVRPSSRSERVSEMTKNFAPLPPSKNQMPLKPAEQSAAEKPAFVKKETPLVEKKQPAVEDKSSLPGQESSQMPSRPPQQQKPREDENETIAKLRSIPHDEHPTLEKGGDAHLDALQERAKAIKARLQKLHGSLGE